MDEVALRARALELWNQALRHHLNRDLKRAIELYSKSIEVYPTAEAYTFRGWAFSGMGRIDDAIAECRSAIEVDPEFGNPYNDIGAYLIEKGELDDAIGWLDRAKHAGRYEPRHFPFMNLGRIYAVKGMVRRAIEEFEGALERCPDEPTCVSMLAQQSANGGTLFLDEIGELPLKLQPKLLRAVETHDVQPVGSSHSYRVDIRLVAATNRDLRAMVKAVQFRDDLYYRMNTAAIFIPPLRERREAIPAFVGFFIEHYNNLFGKDVAKVSRRALETLGAYQWPGNVRELAHAIESAVILAENDTIDLPDLPEPVVNGTGAELLYVQDELAALGSAGERSTRRPHTSNLGEMPLGFLLDDVIKKTLMRSLEETEGNRRRAADLLGVSRSTLYRMLTRYGLAESPRRIGAEQSI